MPGHPLRVKDPSCRALDSGVGGTQPQEHLVVFEQMLQPVRGWNLSGGHTLDWLPHTRQSSFCSLWDGGKGEMKFLMWPTNFQLISINFSLDLFKTKLD